MHVAVLLCTYSADLALGSALQEHWHEAQAELYLSSTQPALDPAREPFMETSILALGEPGYCHAGHGMVLRPARIVSCSVGA